MISSDGASRSRRVLVIEDEILIAMLLGDMLAELGYAVVGPVSDLNRALAAVEQGGFEMGVLDVNLNGRNSAPVAEALRARQIPFVFATGYSRPAPTGFEAVPTLQKPFQLSQLRKVLELLQGDTAPQA